LCNGAMINGYRIFLFIYNLYLSIYNEERLEWANLQT
jgi:hypothetical protein